MSKFVFVEIQGKGYVKKFTPTTNEISYSQDIDDVMLLNCNNKLGQFYLINLMQYVETNQDVIIKLEKREEG